ncbi:hypothetical protein HNR23_004256 [Nocardiopsis mwathae]|uniref:Uncharacterized protein n=1 Tax=Nocardiopsis mwathae TaxID=1472723 RepID=A0A7W9YMB6_9ACTN|nr:hypothetical protein [Nocardiopsis mwathae]MBB6174196.1 hypothetical protein [Nocardiopsis mwathae]
MTLYSHEAASLAELKVWAYYHQATVTIADESWDAITYRADVVCDDGTRYRCLYREKFPPTVAIKRRRNTFTIETRHGPAGTPCYHVRVITPRLSGRELVDPGYLAELVAVATIERKCRARCGATAENLRILTTERTYTADHPSDWRG